MNDQQRPAAIQDFLKELSAATNDVVSLADVKAPEPAGVARIIIYATRVRDIHHRLLDGYNAAEGRSRIIERFFNQWNNMVFGVLYTADVLEKKKALTGRQFEIFRAALDEIIRYTKKFGATYGGR
ncbi:MAG: hypothetical protein HZB29_07165 [Nitrospinae bacterium]|nr:hypothetical protein [Nitrospinota bacterium]